MLVRRKARRTNTLRLVVRDGKAPDSRGLDGSGGAVLTPLLLRDAFAPV